MMSWSSEPRLQDSSSGLPIIMAALPPPTNHVALHGWLFSAKGPTGNISGLWHALLCWCFSAALENVTTIPTLGADWLVLHLGPAFGH